MVGKCAPERPPMHEWLLFLIGNAAIIGSVFAVGVLAWLAYLWITGSDAG